MYPLTERIEMDLGSLWKKDRSADMLRYEEWKTRSFHASYCGDQDHNEISIIGER